MTKERVEARVSWQKKKYTAYLVTSRGVSLDRKQLVFDGMNVSTELAQKFLVHCGGLLSEEGQESLVHRVLNVPLHQRRQVHSQDMREVICDIGPQEKLLNLQGQALKGDPSDVSPIDFGSKERT
jgi:hypothetical protein